MDASLADDQSAMASGPPERGPLDDVLARLLSQTDSVSDAVGELVPFPQLDSPRDARIVRVNIEADVSGEVTARVDLETGETFEAAVAFYSKALERAGVVTQDVEAKNTSHVIVHGASGLPHATQTSLHVDIREANEGSLVALKASYGGFDASRFVDRYAQWHNGTAPVRDASIDGFHVATLPGAGVPGLVGRYTTCFRLADTTIDATRAMVERRLRAARWTWIETTPDELYLDGAFDAEVHLRAVQADTIVEFVGEFPLRSHD